MLWPYYSSDLFVSNFAHAVGLALHAGFHVFYCQILPTTSSTTLRCHCLFDGLLPQLNQHILALSHQLLHLPTCGFLNLLVLATLFKFLCLKVPRDILLRKTRPVVNAVPHSQVRFTQQSTVLRLLQLQLPNALEVLKANFELLLKHFFQQRKQLWLGDGFEVFVLTLQVSSGRDCHLA